MAMDYSQGRYNVIDMGNSIVGRIDEDEFIREFNGPKLLYRIDGEEVYNMSGELVGFIDNGVATTQSGKVLFKIVNE